MLIDTICWQTCVLSILDGTLGLSDVESRKLAEAHMHLHPSIHSSLRLGMLQAGLKKVCTTPPVWYEHAV